VSVIETDGAMATNRYNNFVNVTKLKIHHEGDAVIVESVYVGGTRCNAIALRPADVRKLIDKLNAELSAL
jgi:hypothetical protein